MNSFLFNLILILLCTFPIVEFTTMVSKHENDDQINRPPLLHACLVPVFIHPSIHQSRHHTTTVQPTTNPIPPPPNTHTKQHNPKQAFAGYARFSNIYHFFGVQMRFLVFFSYFYANNVFVYMLLVRDVLGLLL
jgi:hypothetical protein